MNRETIMGIRTGKRRENVDELQRVLTVFGCNIKMRLGLHEAGDVCSDEGLILLQLTGPAEEKDKLREALLKIEGLRFETMEV